MADDILWTTGAAVVLGIGLYVTFWLAILATERALTLIGISEAVISWVWHRKEFKQWLAARKQQESRP